MKKLQAAKVNSVQGPDKETRIVCPGRPDFNWVRD